MKILLTTTGMVRLVMVCVVCGIALGVYLGVADTPESSPPAVDHSVEGPAPVDATAP